MRSAIDTPGNRKRAVAVKLTVVARQLRMTFDRSAEQSGLTRAQWHLIAAVARNPGATQRTLAEALEVREITAGRLVDRLCDEGYLRRDENPHDHRAYSVYLTPAAQPVLDKLDKLGSVHEAVIFADFESDDLARLEVLLDAMARNFCDFRSQRAAAK